MYFAVGSPKVYSVDGGAVVHTATSPCRALVAVLTTDAIQLWSAGVHRVCLSAVAVDLKDGVPLNCVWRQDGRRLCVSTSRNLLQCYELAGGGDNAPPLVRHVDAEGTYATHPDAATANSVWIDIASHALQSAAVLQVAQGFGAVRALAADAVRLYVATEGGRLFIFYWGDRGVLKPALLGDYNVIDLTACLHSSASTPAPSLNSSRRLGTPGSATSPVLNPERAPPANGVLRSSSGMSVPGSVATPTQSMPPPADAPLTIVTISCSAVAAGEVVVTLSDGAVAVLHVAASGLDAASGRGGGVPPAEVKKRSGLHVDGTLSQPLPGMDSRHVVALNSRRRLLAVAHGHAVALHDIDSPLHIEARLHLGLWGWGAEETGEVTEMAWSPDEEVLAVSYRRRGVAVFHWSGACVMTSLPRSGVNDAFTAAWAAPAHEAAVEPEGALQGRPVQSLAWDGAGYHLLLSYARARARPSSESELHQLEFARSVVANSTSLVKGPQVAVCTAKAVWLYRHPELDGLQDNWEVLPLPNSYAVHAPLRHVGFSPDGQFFAACGARGVVLCNTALRKWRLFGVQDQEASFEVVAAPAWCTNAAVCLPARVLLPQPDAAPYKLLFYPRHHLDKASLLLTIYLKDRPVLLDAAPVASTGPSLTTLLVLDATGKFTTSERGCPCSVGRALTGGKAILCFHLNVSVDSVTRPSKVAMSMQAQCVLSVDIPGPLSMLRILPAAPQKAGSPMAEDTLPMVVVLTHRGALEIVSFAMKWRYVVARRVCCFWVDPSLSAHGFVQLLVATPKRISLVALPHPHGRRGSTSGRARGISGDPVLPLGKTPSSNHGFTLGRAAQATAPAAPAFSSASVGATSTVIQEADVDACPVGILASEGLLIHATEGVSTSARRGAPSFHVHVRTLPYLHAVFLALFVTQAAAETSAAEQAACAAAAVDVARALKEHSFFVDVMDYLLHSILHLQDVVDSPSKHVERSTVLGIALKFLCNYEEFFEVLVHSLRKADPGMWPLIFAQCPPLQLFNSALKAGKITASALLLRVLQMPTTDDPLQELRVAACAARKLFPLAIASCKYELSAELVRFLKLLKSELLWSAADEEAWAAEERGDVLPSPASVAPASPASSPATSPLPSPVAQPAGSPPAGEEDPLLDSKWLKECVERSGRLLLRRGRLCDLHSMLGALGLSTRDFIAGHWGRHSYVADPVRVLAALHTQYGLPFATTARRFAPKAGAGWLEVLGAYATGYSRLFLQWRHGGGQSAAAEELAARCEAHGRITPMQVHLLLVPSALAAVNDILAVCEAAQCRHLSFLLRVMVGDTARAVALADACDGRTLLEKCLVDGMHGGYRSLVELLPEDRFKAVKALL